MLKYYFKEVPEQNNIVSVHNFAVQFFDIVRFKGKNSTWHFTLYECLKNCKRLKILNLH